jgi:hypothetical protein
MTCLTGVLLTVLLYIVTLYLRVFQIISYSSRYYQILSYKLVSPIEKQYITLRPNLFEIHSIISRTKTWTVIDDSSNIRSLDSFSHKDAEKST